MAYLQYIVVKLLIINIIIYNQINTIFAYKTMT